MVGMNRRGHIRGAVAHIYYPVALLEERSTVRLLELADQWSAIADWYAGQCPLIDDDKAIIAVGGDSLMIAVDCGTGEISLAKSQSAQLADDTFICDSGCLWK